MADSAATGESFDYDVLVIGSGFGGSVTALRLTEKGYRVGVLEAGDRFDESSYPSTSWDVTACRSAAPSMVVEDVEVVMAVTLAHHRQRTVNPP